MPKESLAVDPVVPDKTPQSLRKRPFLTVGDINGVIGQAQIKPRKIRQASLPVFGEPPLLKRAS
jgi:hypothetical protein